jgi:hypothetical protein
MVFTYPHSFHVRRHGPCGYHDYRAYKPWLRDKFEFRCVYCLCVSGGVPKATIRLASITYDLRRLTLNTTATTTIWCTHAASAMP